MQRPVLPLSRHVCDQACGVGRGQIRFYVHATVRRIVPHSAASLDARLKRSRYLMFLLAAPQCGGISWAASRCNDHRLEPLS